MTMQEEIKQYSKGDNMRLFWWLFAKRKAARNRLWAQLLTVLVNRSAHRHGGYIGQGAQFLGQPCLPHGLHGVFISRYATIGQNCRIYQNVTIGEVNHKAPHIGNNCLIGANAVLVGDITLGNDVTVAAGAVVFFDVPDGHTVFCAAPRLTKKEETHATHQSSMD